jgi:hypothetical protein
VTRPKRGMHLDPGQVPARCGWRGFASDDGTGGGGCVREAGHAGGHGFADGSGYEPKPARPPLTVDRPDPGADDHVVTTLGTVSWGRGEIRFAALLDPNRPGGMARVHVLDREQARHIAAALLLAAERAEEPDPAEVEALAEVIAGTEGGSYAVNAPDLIARAVLAAGYERRRP